MASGVTGLRFIGFAVPDFDTEVAFMTSPWGLSPVSNDGEIAYFAAVGSDQPFIVRVRKTDHKGLDVLGFSVDSRADLDAMYAKLSADADIKIISPPAELTSPGGGYGFRLFDGDGHTLEIAADVALVEKADIKKGHSVPRGLSHVVMHAPDREKSERWYVEKLGFRVSDWIGDFMSFMRCSPAHHRLALLPGPAALNHVAFDMLSVDEMLRGAARMKEAEQEIRWGPGRHTAGDNAFSYFISPNGHTIEYTAGLENVDESWQATRYEPRREVLDQWGIGVGGPETMPHPVPDVGVWKPVTV